jgi:hypothetical protein
LYILSVFFESEEERVVNAELNFSKVHSYPNLF